MCQQIREFSFSILNVRVSGGYCYLLFCGFLCLLLQLQKKSWVFNRGPILCILSCRTFDGHIKGKIMKKSATFSLAPFINHYQFHNIGPVCFFTILSLPISSNATLPAQQNSNESPENLRSSLTVAKTLSQQENQVKPTSPIQSLRQLIISFIKSCTKRTHFLQIHAHIIQRSLIKDPIIGLQFLSRIALSPLQDLSYSSQFFSQIPKPSVPQYNTMIRAYSLSDSPEEGFYMYRDMQRRGLCTDPITGSFAIKSCIRILSLDAGIQVHARILRDGHQSDSLLLTTLMDLYSCCERIHEACKLFDEIPQIDTVAWNVLISCFLRNKRSQDALCLFDVMQSATYTCKPDDVTCLHMLQACSNLNALEFGKRVHQYLEEHGYGGALNLSNSLISMYSRCGCLEKAYEVFSGMQHKNVVTWSAMISGFAMNGYGREAINAFQEMQKMGVPPDAQTLTGVLSACSHCRLVDEGMLLFDCMTKEFGIEPNIHHYGCMVDLMGRAGMVDRAYQLITSMNIKPDSTIWRTLLGACRIHGHVTLAECVIEHLVELRAQEAGDYALLLNIYSSAGYWDKVAEVRTLMKDRAIHTTPGCSTIELKGVIHEFVADDVSHPRKDEIYAMMDEINSQLKIVGYVVEISSELHNMREEDKGYVLSYHSEKLAMAFGVLATPPGTTIRVAKNLRTCIDCHNFAKFLSEVYNREVIIRDRNRFHYFRGGHCSCNDFW